MSSFALKSLSVAVAPLCFLFASCSHSSKLTQGGQFSSRIPNGKRITPLATPGARFQLLNPGLKDFPQYVAGQAMSTAVSPDQKTLLILTSGFNRINGADGKSIPEASEEYVFVYDISAAAPRKKQVIKVPNTFAGITFAPSGQSFYVSGGTDDNLHTYRLQSNGNWEEDGQPIKLGHSSGLGFFVGKEPLAAGGVAVTADGKTVLVANIYNDSVSVIDLAQRRVAHEVDLRPGKNDPGFSGVPGGEFPFWVVAHGNDQAYVSCLRDREVVKLRLNEEPWIVGRIKVNGNPNKMALNRSGSRLYVAADNSDSVSVIDTSVDKVVEVISTTGPPRVIRNVAAYRGSAPNDVAVSHDGRRLFVTNGGSNSVAVIQLGDGR